MENRWDFLQWLGPDASTSVFTRLDEPADLVRASAVSRSWRRFVVEHGLSRSLCTRKFPEVLNFSNVINESNADVECSSSYDWTSLEKSTDDEPFESIQNTLVANEIVGGLPSYWSSGGQNDTAVPETLTYSLISDFCVVDEIKIQPFKAFFQDGHPIYSSKFVRFRFGSRSRKAISAYTNKSLQLDHSEKYNWTYVSPKFAMIQENVLQSFKLPHPVICIGGILQIELMERVQRQAADGLFYICVCHVEAIGRSLSPPFQVINLLTPGSMTLWYLRRSCV
ncbi:F-box protein At4g00755-like isoform X2 [Zingiber officinale]|uniref:F-box protein At4g00755-like isoform X2 n=1 Tax=Zingiber officinale TaxID=94328 RepID=UPI001C4CE544|nr:F-box protein At4g00755-like isoform X2 [Zingiber officinale]